MMELAIRNCFKGKWKRRDIRNLLSRHCEYTPGKILKLLKTGNKHMLDGAVHNLALELNNRLMNRELSLPPTVSRTVIEGTKQKERNLEIESYEHQIFDHLADLDCRNCLRRSSEHGSVHPSKAEVSSIRKKELRNGFGQIRREQKWPFSVMSENVTKT